MADPITTREGTEVWLHTTAGERLTVHANNTDGHAEIGEVIDGAISFPDFPRFKLGPDVLRAIAYLIDNHQENRTMNPADHRFQDDKQISAPQIGHYEDLLMFQRRTIEYQSRVIEELTKTIERREAVHRRGGVVDAQVIGGGY